MQTSWNILVVSARLENRRALVRILDGLPTNVIASSTLSQAWDVLAKQEIHLVFCDDCLPGGTYRDLLSVPTVGKPRFVVIADPWQLESPQGAMEEGAFDLLRRPIQPTDVELIVIRAARDLRQPEYRMTA
jgi:DNA-binding NtrC family response regulator